MVARWAAWYAAWQSQWHNAGLHSERSAENSANTWGIVDMDFAGRVALITGAANGIGRAASLGFARAGARVVLEEQGKVSQGTPSHVTADGARAAVMAYGCSNVSSLSRGPNDTWHGRCQKGGDTIDVIVDQQGKVSK